MASCVRCENTLGEMVYMGGGYEGGSTDALNLDKLSYKQGKLFMQVNYFERVPE